MDYLNKLINQELLTREETCQLMLQIANGELSSISTGAILSCLQMRGISPDELLGFRDGLFKTGVQTNLSEYEPLDIVGTGGDKKDTFNISTCSAFVVAGAGFKVAKHGNYSATSTSGASNILENHGAKFSNNIDKLRESIEKCNIAYLHAPLFATAMKYVAPTRKELGVPTCFNLLGPLINPAHPKYEMLGVANLRQMRLYAHALKRIGIKFCLVNSIDGYDEISLTGNFKTLSTEEERIYNPNDLGFENIAPTTIRCKGDAKIAIEIFDNILRNEATTEQTNVVTCNAAFAIKLINNKTIEDCIEIAKESLKSGKALKTFQNFIEINN